MALRRPPTPASLWRRWAGNKPHLRPPPKGAVGEVDPVTGFGRSLQAGEEISAEHTFMSPTVLV